MINDLFSLTEADYTDVASNPSNHLVYYSFDGRQCARHAKHGPLSSSEKVDKKIFENIRRELKATGNKASYQGNFNGGDVRNFVDAHLKSTYILKVDLKSFYNSISYESFEKVVGADYPDLSAIKSIYFNPNLLVGLAASAVIAEKFIQKVIDSHINAFIHRRPDHKTVAYTRFYDDIYVSSNDRNMLEELKKDMSIYLGDHNLQFNAKKTRIGKVENSLILNSRVNKGEVNVGRRFKNNLRLQLHRHNPDTTTLDYTYRTISEVYSIIGKLSYIIRMETKPSQKWISIHAEYMMALDEYKAIRDQYIYQEIS